MAQRTDFRLPMQEGQTVNVAATIVCSTVTVMQNSGPSKPLMIYDATLSANVNVAAGTSYTFKSSSGFSAGQNLGTVTIAQAGSTFHGFERPDTNEDRLYSL